MLCPADPSMKAISQVYVSANWGHLSL